MSGGAGSCQIHLREDARRRAAEAVFPLNPSPTDPLVDLNLAAWDGFTGPHFKQCVEGVDLTIPGWVNVLLDDGTVYSYPANDVARVKTYEV